MTMSSADSPGDSGNSRGNTVPERNSSETKTTATTLTMTMSETAAAIRGSMQKQQNR